MNLQRTSQSSPLGSLEFCCLRSEFLSVIGIWLEERGYISDDAKPQGRQSRLIPSIECYKSVKAKLSYPMTAKLLA